MVPSLGISIAPTPAMGYPALRSASASPAAVATVASAVIFDKVSFAFDEHVVLDDVSFSVPQGSMRILLGASGAGKSVVLKLILGLLRPDSGTILVNGQRIDAMNERDLTRVRADIGMLFQENALFDSLTVAENVGYRLLEETDMPESVARSRVEEVLGFVGLGEFTDRLPSELSGGQRRRVAIARAMAAKPSLLLFDDPTSGLDPIIATTVDDQIVKLRDLEHVHLDRRDPPDSGCVLRRHPRGDPGTGSSAHRSGDGSRPPGPVSWSSTTDESASKERERSCGHPAIRISSTSSIERFHPGELCRPQSTSIDAANNFPASVKHFPPAGRDRRSEPATTPAVAPSTLAVALLRHLTCAEDSASVVSLPSPACCCSPAR